ncbi:MAG: hypothetical protein NPIRA04_27020 [Nitrospirales bacterium]|nr:MAG: hypothetical protein NPIRA04_27020 [Nitrospirales bacterium]
MGTSVLRNLTLIFQRSTRTYYVPYLIICLLISIGVIQTFSNTINHDVAWHLYTAAEYLAGGTLYHDIFWEPNFPLTLYLTIPPVYLAHMTDLSAINLFILYIFCLISLSLFLTWNLLTLSPESPLRNSYALLLSASYALVVVPGADFGQREHIMSILTMPYIILAVLRIAGGVCAWPLRVFIGSLAGIGFSLKPHFLLIPLIIECYRWIKLRHLQEKGQSETFAFISVTGLYGITLAFLNSEYFSTVLPYALTVYNIAYQSTLQEILIQPETILLPLTCLMYFKTRQSQNHVVATEMFLLSAIGFYFIFFIQMKGWHYHIYPVLSSLILTVTSMLIHEIQRSRTLVFWSGKNEQLPINVWILMTLFLCTLGTPYLKTNYENPTMNRMMPIVKEHAADSSIFTFSSSLHTAFPLVNYAEVGWASRFPTLWLLPGIVRLQRDATTNLTTHEVKYLQEIKQFVIDSVISDLSRKQPAIILLDVNRYKYFFDDHFFDYLKFFSSDPKFMAIWSHYKKINDIGGFQVFLRTST